MIEREKESEKSQLELKEWIEKKRNEIEKELEEQKKMMLKQQMEKKSREDKRKKI